MNCEWETIASELGLSSAKEIDIHPHDPKERSELFHVRDASGSTEYEFLNLIHAFVMAIKPALVIETGTFTGMGTLAIAHALSWNGFGTLITVDLEDCNEAKEHVKHYAVDNHVQFVKSDSLEFCSDYKGELFDMAFIDSGPHRLLETNALANGKLSSGALVILHDASPLRVGQSDALSWHSLFEERCPLRGHTIPLSRGLRIMFA